MQRELRIFVSSPSDVISERRRADAGTGMDAVSRPALRHTLRVWSRLALLSFGSPAVQLAAMHRTLVEEKRWISEARFLNPLNYCITLPRPETQLLPTY